METNAPPMLEGLSVVLPPRLMENFEKADGQLMKYYGESPGVPALVRLWVACSTSSSIRKEFERQVLDIKKPNLSQKEEDYFNEASL